MTDWLNAYETRVNELRGRADEIRRSDAVRLDKRRQKLALARDWVALYDEIRAAHLMAGWSVVLGTVLVTAAAHHDRRVEFYEDLVAKAEDRAARRTGPVPR